MTRLMMHKKFMERCKQLSDMFEDESIDDKRIFEELTHGIYAGDEFNRPILDIDWCFKYRGFEFELSNCLSGVPGHNKTDRYVCWMWTGRCSDENYVLKKFSAHPDCWTSDVVLVPNCWAWGAEEDLKAGKLVEKLILDQIDLFIEWCGAQEEAIYRLIYKDAEK